MESKTIVYVIILVSIELLTVTSIKKWSITKNNIYLVLGLLGYLVVGALFAYILYVQSEMTIVNSLWQVLNIIVVSVLGLVIYKEKLTTLQYVGVFCAIIASVLLTVD